MNAGEWKLHSFIHTKRYFLQFASGGQPGERAKGGCGMRCLPRLVVGLLTVLLLLVPLTARAYSEWPAISSRAMRITLETDLPLNCCLESHVGNIYLKGPIRDFGKFIGFLLDLGLYLREHTNAGSYYLIRVHFEDHVRSISVQELMRFRNKVKTGYNDPIVIYEFFRRFRDQ